MDHVFFLLSPYKLHCDKDGTFLFVTITEFMFVRMLTKPERRNKTSTIGGSAEGSAGMRGGGGQTKEAGETDALLKVNLR